LILIYLVKFAVAFAFVAFVAFVPDSWTSSFPVWLHSAKQNCEYDGKCTRHDKDFSNWHPPSGLIKYLIKWLSIFS